MEQENKPNAPKSSSLISFFLKSFCFIIVFFIIFFLFLPSITHPPKTKAKEIVCRSNLKSISLVVRLYSEDNKTDQTLTSQSLATAEKWNEVIYPYLLTEKPNMCPSVKKQDGKTCTYLLNKNLYDLKGPIPDDMVLAFEGAVGWNQTGGPEDMVFRHGTEKDPSCNVALCDGSVMRVRKSEAAALKWKP